MIDPLCRKSPAFKTQGFDGHVYRSAGKPGDQVVTRKALLHKEHILGFLVVPRTVKDSVLEQHAQNTPGPIKQGFLPF